MPIKPKDRELDFDNLLESLVQDVTDSLDADSGGNLNIIEFIEQELDLGIQLAPRQILLLKVIYGLELTEEEESVLEYWQAIGRCRWWGQKVYQIVVWELGRRASKTTLCSIIGAYEFYKLCKLASPQKFFGISKSSSIAILVIATTADQAKRSIFVSITGVIQNCKYFKRLQEQGKLFVQKESVEYPEKAIGIYSGNSQSASQVGFNILVLIMDEFARFKDSDGKSNAMALWSNIGISTAVFGSHSKRFAISSAWCKGDAIEELLEKTHMDENAFGLQAKSWDINPVGAARDNPVVASEYIANPSRAALEFEGIRKATEDPFLDEEEITRAFSGISAIEALPYIKELNPADPLDIQEVLETSYSHNSEETFITEENDSRRKRKGPKTKFVSLQITDIHPLASGRHSVLHLDPAITSDAYALAFGHNEFTEDGDQIVVIPGILAWEPTIDADVSIKDVQKAVIQIHRVRPLASITADHYASPETIQRFQESGLNAEVTFFSNNLQMQMYTLVRSLLHEDRLILPADSRWRALLHRELSRLTLIKQNKIDHPKGVGNSKDIADCIAAVCWRLAQRVAIDKALALPSLLNRTPQPNVLANHPINPHQILQPPMGHDKTLRNFGNNGMQRWKNFRDAGGRLS